MYLLPNKNKVDTDGVMEALLDGDIANIYFLDIEKGDIVCVTADEIYSLQNIREQKERYFEIPRVSKRNKEKWMREFVRVMIPFEDIPFSEKLLAIPKAEFFEKALKEIKKSKDGWIHGWSQWSSDCAFEILNEWFATLPVEIINKWEGCDDCAFCKAMASGSGSTSDLLKAFSEEKFMSEIEKLIENKKKIK